MNIPKLAFYTYHHHEHHPKADPEPDPPPGSAGQVPGAAQHRRRADLPQALPAQITDQLLPDRDQLPAHQAKPAHEQ